MSSDVKCEMWSENNKQLNINMKIKR